MGIETSNIKATLKDTNNNPIPGAKVNFSTNKGTLDPQSDPTENDGKASTKLTSQARGTATVTARYGLNVSDSVNVNFTSPSKKYKCVNRECVEDPDGPYDTLAKCRAACEAPEKWKCVRPGQCEKDPKGTYNTLAECMRNCPECPGAPHPP